MTSFIAYLRTEKTWLVMSVVARESNKALFKTLFEAPFVPNLLGPPNCKMGKTGLSSHEGSPAEIRSKVKRCAEFRTM